ncbi:YceI family protein [Colwelliaceae bacterium 6441]
MIHCIQKITLLLCTSLLAFQSMADWQLTPDNSTVNFTSVKKEHLIENHYFNRVSANITEQGEATLTIDLSSVNTKIAIRDQRIKEHLFNIATFPQATFSAQIDMQKIATLLVGSTGEMQISGQVDLHGHKQNLVVKVLVTKVSKDIVLVASQESLIIKAQDFDLVAGINKLKSLANLPSISYSVPVNFVLTFTHQ